MTDAELERHLQALFRTEIPADETAPAPLRSALGAIPAAVPSSRLRPVPRRRIGLLAVAAVVTTLVAGGLLVGSGAFRRSPDKPPSDPAFVAPTSVASAEAATGSPVPTRSGETPGPTPSGEAPAPQPTPTPAPTPSVAASACENGKGQFLAGDTTPTSADVAPAALSTGQGAYVMVDATTRSLWTVGRDERTASLVGGAMPADSDLAVLDVGPHQVSALVRITPPPVEDRDTFGCTGLYLVQLDGKGVRQVTTDVEEGFISGAAFSPDGSRIAYVQWSPMRVTVVDVAAGTRVIQPCETGQTLNDTNTPTVAWSPDSTKIAADCGGLVFIVDPTGATPPFVYPRGDYTVGFRWAADGTLVVARDPGGLALRGLHVDSFDVASRTATVLGRVDAANLEDMFMSFRLSPGGRWLSFTGAVLTAVPMDKLEFVGYVVPVTGGVPRQILTAAEADRVIGWSTDGRALLFVGPGRALTSIDVDTLERTVVGTLPRDYAGGIWLIP